ncbi:pyrroline-5-carboxylate reductase [Niveomyces insectorum RCEF 264]|uniref:Pyrroline-5-carboxylate reductase n=1 Tax=Niveomyces insectorum RCEF 264 TaxID=1081102 RepID=A0A162MDW3_9HYPO|nr:pyrroline-5-carboxylate reductase [Niveomyces insectorum RCEF 264]
MPLPQPAVALTNICSVIHNNTLYTYSAAAFQSLALTPGAKWKQLPSGEPVTGGVCVGSTPGDPSQAGFYVVGGKSATASYNGLQKYTYSTGQWATITPQTLVTQDRLYHSAVYLNDTDTIFMYAGSQDGSMSASSQTFTIQASAPYGVVAYQSIAPAAISPILLPWSSAEAVMLGGSNSNTEITLFNPSTGGWSNSGANLLNPLATNASGLQAALVTGDDGSKNLYTFDATVSPNQVSRIVLMDGNGQPMANAGPVKRSLQPETRQVADHARRAAATTSAPLTLNDWPAYNASDASTAVRSGFSLAQSPQGGMIVLAGGAGGGDELLSVFNGRTNSWQNATRMLAAKQNVPTTTKSSASVTPTSVPPTLIVAPSSTTSAPAVASSSSTTAAEAPPPPASHSLSANAVIGIVLGAIAGMGLVFLILYLVLLRRRKRRDYLEAAHSRRASGTLPPEKDPSFVVANDSFAQRTGKGTFRGGHQAQDSQGSFPSVAIMMGRVNQPRASDTIQRHNSRETKRSSTNSVFNKGFKSTISKPILNATSQQSENPAGMAGPRHAPFERGGVGAGVGAGAAAAATSAYGRSVTDPKQPTNNNMHRQGSTRRSSGWNRYWSGGSALNLLGFGSGHNNNNNNGHANNGSGQNSRSSKRTTVASEASSNYSTNQHRITQDSATVPPLEIPVVPDSKPRFQRVNSGSPTIANYDMSIKNGLRGKIERSVSNSSSHSGYSSGIPASVHDTWDPTATGRPWGADRAATSNVFNTPLAPAFASSSGGKKAPTPSGMSRQPQLAMADTSSDMSWLNLGDVSSRV